MLKHFTLLVYCCLSFTAAWGQINLDSSLIGYWPLNGNGNDLSTNAYNGTLSATGVYPTNDRRGVSGQAMLFNGALENGDIGMGGSYLNSLDTVTFAAWVRTDTYTSSDQSIFGQDNVFEVVTRNGPNRIRIFTAVAGVRDINISVPAGEWFHLMIACTPSNMTVYINGLPASTFTGNFALATSTFPVRFGGRVANQTNSNHFRGAIDEGRLYDRLLSADEITYLSSSLSLTLALSNLVTNSYCTGDNISIPFTKLGGGLMQGNVFTAQLSDSSGSFTAPVTLGTLVDTNAGTINGVIPANLPSGTGYKLRIVASSPSYIGTTSSFSLSIQNPDEGRSTLTRGRILYYPFDGNAADSSGNGQNGTLAGGTSFVADRFGNVTGALQLNGSNGHVVVPNGVWFDGAFTVSTWLNPQAYANWSRIFDFSVTTGNETVLAAVSNGTSGNLATQVRQGSTILATPTGGSAPLNQWSHIAFVHDGTSQLLYLNGNLVASAASGTPRLVTRLLNYIGRSSFAADAYANAAFDDFAIYNRGLTLEEVRVLAEDGLIFSNAPVCEGGALQLNAPVITNATYAWSGPDGFSSNLRNPIIANVGAANSGSYSLTITTTGCAPVSQNKTINIVTPGSQPTVSFSGLPATTNTGAASNTLTGTPAGGYFSGNGISGSVFDPAVAGVGTHVISYNVTGTGGCTTTALDTIIVGPTFNMSNGTFNVCQGGFFDSGGRTANYNNNESFTSTFCSDNGERLQFTFTAMSMGTGDTLWAYDGPDSTGALLAYYVNFSNTDIVWSSGTCITFRFTSNSTATTTGWQANFECLADPVVLNEAINISYGLEATCSAIIRDPAGTGNYGYGYAEQVLRSADSTRLRLDFFEFNINFNNGGHWLRIYDGPTTAWPLIGQYNSCCAPPTIIESSGQFLTIVFDATNTNAGVGSRQGFAANVTCFGSILPEYTINEPDTVDACLGVFYDSGGGNTSYSANEDFVKTFCSDIGNNIQIEFNLNNTQFGTGDTLFAFDGPDVNSPPLGVYVAGSRIETLTSLGTCLTFRFKSNSTSQGRGWQGAISCVNSVPASTNYLLSSGIRYTCGGEIFDPAGTGNYGYGYNIMTFGSYNGTRLRLDFSVFNINFNNGGHWLRIYDGPSTAYPLIGQYNSCCAPPTIIESSGRFLTVEFDANNTNAGVGSRQGFQATLTCFGNVVTEYLMSTDTVVTCNGIFYDSQGGGANYTNSEDFTKTFCADSGDLLQFTFNPNNTQFGTGDTLWAYDGSDTSAQLLGIYVAGSTIETLTSAGTCVTFRFTSNTSSTGRGWQAAISCVSTPPASVNYNLSSGVRYTCSAVLRDPGGTGNYPAGTWTQTYGSYNGNRLRLVFTELAINGNNGGHWLDVYDGPSTAYPLIGSYNQWAFPPNSTVESSGRYLTLVFRSTNNAAGLSAGFTANLTCITPPLTIITHSTSTVNVCGGVYYDDAGPDSNYLDSQDKTQTICSGNGQLLQMIFNHNNTQFGAGDTLWAYDGASTSAPQLGMYVVGSRIDNILSTGTCLTFRFKSDGTGNGRGWQGFINCISSPTNVTYVMSSGERNVCSGAFTDPGGGSDYPRGTWEQTFTSYSGERLRFTYNSFSVNGNNGGHWLRVYDGPSTASPLIGSYNNFNFPPAAIQSSGSSLTFRFESTNTLAGVGPGFNFSITCFTGNPIDVAWLPSPVCQGGTMAIPYTVNSPVNPGNVFTAQLSDVNGNFSSPVSIGTLTSDSSGTIVGTIPLATTPGGNYRIRVISNNPAQVGSQSPNAITVTPTPVAPNNISISGSSTFCNGTGSATLSVVNQTGVSFRWILDDTVTVGTNSNTYVATQSGTYKVELFNGCDTVTVVNPLVIANDTTLATPTISANGATSFCSSGSVTLSIPAQSGVTYQWKNGATNVGTNTNSYTATTAGTYTVALTNACGTVISANSISVTITGSVPSTPTITAGGATIFCNGDSVTLSIPAQAGVDYQWKNGSTNVGNSSNNFTATAAGAYTVEISNGCGTRTSTNSINVTVNNPPVAPSITVNGPLSFCTGGSVALEIPTQAGVSYQWKNGATNVGTNANTYTATSAGSYTIEVTNGCGTVVSTNSITVTITGVTPTAPTITAGGATTFCNGDSVVLSIPTQAGVNYQWKNGSTNVGTNSNTFTATAAGTYSVEVSNGCGNFTSTNSITVTVNNPPVAPSITANGPLSFCTGGSVTLEIPAQAGVSYQWKRGTTDVGTNTNTYIASVAGDYTVELTNGCGTVVATNIVTVVTLGSPPAASTISANGPTTFCSGDSVTLSVAAQAGVSYQWKRNGSNTGINQSTLVVNQAGTYTVDVFNACDTVAASNSITVTISGSAPAAPSITAGGATTFCSGQSVTLNVPTQTGVDYQWKNGSTNIGTNSNSFTATTAGTYTVELSNACGNATSTNSITVTISGTAPNVPTITAGGPTSFCAGGSVTLSTTAQAGVTYQWKNGATNVGTNTNTFTTTTAGTYTVEVSNSCGTFASSNSITVTISGSAPTAPSITAGGATTFCSGQSVTLNVPTQTGVDYQWKNGSTNIGTNSNSFTATTAGTYTVELSNACGNATSTNSITVTISGTAPNVPTITAGGPTSFCAGGSVTLSTTAQAGVTYQWKNSATNVGTNTNTFTATTAGTYTVEVSNSCGTFVSSNSINVTISGSAPAAPSITAGGATTFCSGQSVTLNVPTQTGVDYQWKNGSTNVGTNSNSFTATAAGTYTVELSNACGNATSTNSITVTISGTAPNVPTISAGGPTSFCAGGSVTLSTTAQAGVTYQWKNGATNVGTNTNTFTATTAGNYTVEVSNSCGTFASSNSITVTIETAPAAPTISANGPTAICSGGSVTLSIPAQPGASYQWRNGAVDVGANTNTYVATIPGPYTVEVTNTCGSAMSSNTITVTVTTAPATPVITSNSPLCEGETLTLSTDSVGGATYAWEDPLGNPIGNSRAISIANAGLFDGGVYTVTVNVGGCPSADATVFVEVFPIPLEPIVTTVANVLTATGQNIEWYSAGQSVGTGNVYTAEQSGWYLAVTTDAISGCQAASDSVFVQVVGLENIDLAATINLYPNPSDQTINISLPTHMIVLETLIYDVSGTQVRRVNTMELGKPIAIDDLAPGAYRIHLKTEEGAVVKPFVIVR